MRRLRSVAVLMTVGVLASVVTVSPVLASESRPTLAAQPAAAYGGPSSFVSGAIIWTGRSRNYIWPGSSGPWCGKFVSQMAKNANVNPYYISWTDNSATETSMMPHGWALKRSSYSAWANRGVAGFAPQPGDLVFIGHNVYPDQTISHIGIVQGWDGTRVYTIEGNPPAYGGNGDPNGTVVTRRMYVYTSSLGGTLVLAGQTTRSDLSMSPGNFGSAGSPADPNAAIRIIDVITPHF